MMSDTLVNVMRRYKAADYRYARCHPDGTVTYYAWTGSELMILTTVKARDGRLVYDIVS